MPSPSSARASLVAVCVRLLSDLSRLGKEGGSISLSLSTRFARARARDCGERLLLRLSQVSARDPLSTRARCVALEGQSGLAPVALFALQLHLFERELLGRRLSGPDGGCFFKEKKEKTKTQSLRERERERESGSLFRVFSFWGFGRTQDSRARLSARTEASPFATCPQPRYRFQSRSL